MGTTLPSHSELSLLATDSREKELDHTRFIKTFSSFSSSSSTKSIPIPKNRDDIRDAYEIQEQEWIAEERDFIMFHRLINGMISSSSLGTASLRSETDKSIANIMRTHYKKMDSKSTKDSSSNINNEDETKYVNNESSRDESMTDANGDDNASEGPPEMIFIMDDM